MRRSIGLMVSCLMLAQSPVLAERTHDRLIDFEKALEANPSATKVLQDWCGRHEKGTHILARRLDVHTAPPQEARRNLHLRPGEAIGYRRVQLMCGAEVLSNADNWYLPDKLTPQMNKTLADTDTPFGVAVSALHFTRRNLETKFLSFPVRGVLRHSAVLVTASGDAFSFVVETYTQAILR